MKTQFKFARILYLFYRGSVRVLTVPFRPLPEGKFKNSIRKSILNFQHSLPTEFVVNKGDTVVQIGTPWPKTMKRFLRALGPNGTLVIVEAMPENQERLEQAIESEGIKNVILIKGAAFSETRSGSLKISPYKGDHKIAVDGIDMDNDLKPGNDEMDEIPVEFFRLDDVLPKHGIEEFDYLSVTVNGAEAEVLKGTSAFFENPKPWMRIYAKGHAKDAEGKPLHLQTNSVMQSFGFRTKITKGEPSSTLHKSWLWRDGDLYAWSAGE